MNLGPGKVPSTWIQDHCILPDNLCTRPTLMSTTHFSDMGQGTYFSRWVSMESKQVNNLVTTRWMHVNDKHI
jgi:hypothetical protein